MAIRLRSRYSRMAKQATLVQKTVEIGDWNMNSSAAGDATKNISHGLTTAQYKALRAIVVIIRNDTGATTYKLEQIDTDGTVAGGIIDIGSAAVRLRAVAGKTFDAVGFDATGYNRGWINLWYAV